MSRQHPCKLLQIIAVVTMCMAMTAGLKHTGKSEKTQGSGVSGPTTQIDNAKQQQKTEKQSKQSKVQAKITAKQSDSQPESQAKTSTLHDMYSDIETLYQWTFIPVKNQYMVPVNVSNQTFNLALTYDEQSSKYGNLPSWFYTNLTKQQHELCLEGGECEQVNKYLKCQQKTKKKTNSSCYLTGKVSYTSDLFSSTKKVHVQLQNYVNRYGMEFVTPTKVNLPEIEQGEKQIHGGLNLAMGVSNKYEKSIVMYRDYIRVISQKEINKLIEAQSVLNTDKTSFFNFGDVKELYVHTVNKKTDNVTNNIKEVYEKIKMKFSNTERTLLGSKKMITAIRNIVKKQFFGDRCKDLGDNYTCSAPPVRNITQISLCRNQNGSSCINLPISGFIIQQLVSNKTYKFVIEQNDNKDEQKILYIYPKLAQIYDIYMDKGIVKGVKATASFLKEEAEEAAKIKEQAKEEKEDLERTESQIEKEEEAKKMEQEQEQKKQVQVKTGKKHAKKEDKQEQNEEDEDQQDKGEEDDEKDEQETAEQQEPSEEQSVEEKKPQKSKTNIKSQKEKRKTKQQQSEPQQRQLSSQSQSQKPASTKKKPKNTKSSSHSTAIASGSQQQQRQYSKGALFFVVVYGLVFLIILVVIKLKAQQSLAAAAIDRVLDVVYYGIVKNYFNKSQGYNAPKLEQEQHVDEADHSDSVAVGYTEKQGRDLFWQRNSVEGI